ncbi:hypothetical protein LPB140_03445 [Sphingorhabdus lutea]|uniref:SMP-30/Gluconolactonase/LRE-like region domain-containing protein n=2 Tax=Sphingorhabdus lutea TaxID=1913578 RepID=A0A1L3JEF2_9SPHN|nr:hypothetical protein LPB140_03445 [Sphingorhabdus lutea]
MSNIAPLKGDLFGGVEKLSPKLDDIIDPQSRLEKLASGFSWSEGPIWDANRGQLYFSDVPQNKIYQWREDEGLRLFLDYAGLAKDGDLSLYDSAGTNGLIMGKNGDLIIASHGKRALTRMNIDNRDEIILSDKFKGKKFNSPNDLIEDRDGVIYFTDPPYGLKNGDQSPMKEQSVNGVYRRDINGRIDLIDDSLRRPNGIALSPDERTLYVSNSDEARQIMKSYAISSDGKITDKGVFFDASPFVGPNSPGLPDGMCVAKSGIIFATGPGGVFIISPKGEYLGRIRTEKACANCTIGNDGRYLYLTISDILARIKLRTAM